MGGWVQTNRDYIDWDGTLNVRNNLNVDGLVGIGTRNPSGKLTVDSGTTSNYDCIKGTGSINNYLQLNIKNTSTGNGASSDVVATSDNGSETTYYIDMGVNSSTYNGAAYTIGGVNDGYLYTSDGDLAIGTASAAYLCFHTGGTLAANERVRVTATGNVGINNIAPAQKLHVSGAVAFTSMVEPTLGLCSGALFVSGGALYYKGPSTCTLIGAA